MAKTQQRTESAAPAEASAPTAAVMDPAAGTISAADYRDRVAMRAYELYLERGGADGGDFDDWLAAERELASARPRSQQSE